MDCWELYSCLTLASCSDFLEDDEVSWLEAVEIFNVRFNEPLRVGGTSKITGEDSRLVFTDRNERRIDDDDVEEVDSGDQPDGDDAGVDSKESSGEKTTQS